MKWIRFKDLPIGEIFGFGGFVRYKKTGVDTFRELCSFDRFERRFSEKDLGKLVIPIGMAEQFGSEER